MPFTRTSVRLYNILGDVMKVINKPVEMIAYHSKDGAPTPVKFKIQDDDQQVVIKVDRVITQSSDKIAGKRFLLFVCESSIDDTTRSYVLQYNPESFVWLLHKM